MKNKILIISIAIVLVFSVLSCITNIVLYSNYTKKVNETVLNIVGMVREKYPDVTEQELVNILNNNEDYVVDLSMYGISSDDLFLLESTRTIYHVFIITNIVITLLLGITFIYLLLRYIKNRKNKVNELSNYIKEINKKNYALNLEENNEDELSILQNELYKITVLLKEQSINAINDKKNIKDSLSDISHQLKTPLTSIMIGIDNILDNPKMKSSTKEEFLRDIKKQIENINFLIISILKLSRFDANVITFVKEEISVKKLIDETLKNLESISSYIKIEINGDKDISFIGDYKWEVEALTNIIKNCIEHLDKDGVIKISYRKLSIYTEIVIEDNGKGIDKKDLKHIFERFYKGKNSSTDSIGIGLSLAKRIIENDNGYITVQSKLNNGTKFIIKYGIMK